MGEPGGNGAAMQTGRRDGGGWAAWRKLLCGGWAARSETEREERDGAAGLYLALPRPDGWRITAAP